VQPDAFVAAELAPSYERSIQFAFEFVHAAQHGGSLRQA